MSSKKEKYLLIVSILATVLVAVVLVFSGSANTEGKSVSDNHDEYSPDEYGYGTDNNQNVDDNNQNLIIDDVDDSIIGKI